MMLFYLWFALQLVISYGIDWRGSTELRIPFSITPENHIDCKSVSTPGEIGSVAIVLTKEPALYGSIHVLCSFIQGVIRSEGLTSCLIFCSDINVWPVSNCDHVISQSPNWNSENGDILSAHMEVANTVKFDDLKVCVFADPMWQETEAAIYSTPLLGHLVIQHDVPIVAEVYPFPLDKVEPFPDATVYAHKSSPNESVLESVTTRTRRTQAAVNVQVNTGLDTAVNSSQCDPEIAMPCNFRSAVAYCIEDSRLSNGTKPCVITVQYGVDIIIDPTLGPINVGDEQGHVNLHIKGNGGRVYPQSSDTQFMNFQSTTGRFTGLSIQDLQVESFGLIY
jgi:hypothetical protein